jgi:hypothetical protein
MEMEKVGRVRIGFEDKKNEIWKGKLREIKRNFDFDGAPWWKIR